jgi:hypothetical protein
MLSINWRRLAMIAAVVVSASAFTNGALAAGNPVPANLKQQTWQLITNCKSIFKPGQNGATCDLNGSEPVAKYFRRSVTAAQWKKMLEIGHKAEALCYKLRPSRSYGKLASHDLIWAPSEYSLRCAFGKSFEKADLRIEVRLAPPGGHLDSPVCSFDNCTDVGTTVMRHDGVHECADYFRHHMFCENWENQSPAAGVEIDSIGTSQHAVLVHEDDNDLMNAWISQALGILPRLGG